MMAHYSALMNVMIGAARKAARWHAIARVGGTTDQFVDDFVRKMKPEDRDAGEAAAKPWIAMIAANTAAPSPQPVPPPARP